ncbi:MAG TPA: sigma-70 family RNA polymerase sigma factor [Actinomycetota bacterium]|jgi:RNA polymerase sigma-70 factor (ECF subfamily)|nr:sigma-70 family RNA polymerase sigma factor [Actinomycetota bacterium]
MERRMRDPDLGPYEDWGDAELVVLSRDEPEAFGVVFERYAEDLLRYFAKRTLDPEAAAELVAETFAEAFASRRRFRDRGLGAVGWLYGIGRHQLGRFFRTGAVDARARRRLGMPEREVSAEDYERIEELIDFEEVGRAIGQAFAFLSEEQREALTLRVVEGRSYREVAEELRCTEETARARVSRGLKRLARSLETPLETEPGR